MLQPTLCAIIHITGFLLIVMDYFCCTFVATISYIMFCLSTIVVYIPTVNRYILTNILV